MYEVVIKKSTFDRKVKIHKYVAFNDKCKIIKREVIIL
jgi:hypothetical protein